MFDLIRQNARERDLYNLPQLFHRLLDLEPGRALGGLVPAVDVIETDSEYQLVAECPGLDKASLSVTLENGTLTLSGEKKSPFTDDKLVTHSEERRFGKFSRSFTVPAQVEAGKVQARYADGILHVTLPKAAAAQPQKIQVK